MMIFRAILLSITIITASPMYALKASNEVKQLMPKKWHKLNRLLNAEIKRIRRMGNLGPRLEYRLVELYSEQIKLIKEKENMSFINADTEMRKTKGKKSFFRESMRLYYKTKKRGLSIIKGYPRFPFNAGIYYTLALNSRDYGGDKFTEKYLKLSLRNAGKGDPIIHNAKTTLAEFYYNNKNYKRAIKYYLAVLKDRNDEWLSKHHYNISWCYFKERDYNKSIEHINRAFVYSKMNRYITMNDQIFNTIGLFYVFAGRIVEGSEFYIKNVERPDQHLIKMSKRTAEKGKFEDTRYLLNIALNNAKVKKQHDSQVAIHLSELEIYRDFKKMGLYFKTAQTLSYLNEKRPLKDEFKDEAVAKIKSLVGHMQIRISKNQKVDNYDYDPAKLKRIIQYFDILSSLEKENKDQYRFFQGETFYSVGKYLAASKVYRSALDISKKNEVKEVQKENKRKLQRKILDSLLGTLSEANFKKSVKVDLTIYTYKNHLELWPVDQKSRKIYLKLFNLYLERKDREEALKVLQAYVKNYVVDIEIQRGMLTRIIDANVAQKNAARLAFWINKLNKGFLKFKKSYIEKATLILGQILFGKYQKMDANGKKDAATKGLISLYENKRYPQKIKAESAFNASVLLVESGKVKESLKWLRRGVENYTKNEFFKLLPETLIIAEKYYLLQNFNSSIAVSEMALEKFCMEKFTEKDKFYKNLVYFQLLEGKYDEAIASLDKYDNCQMTDEVVSQVEREFIIFLVKNKKYRQFFKIFKKFKNRKGLKNLIYTSIVEIYWDSKYTKREQLQASIKRVFRSLDSSKKGSKKFKSLKDILNILRFEEFENQNSNLFVEVIPQNKVFKESEFNKQLELRIIRLKVLNANAKEHLATRRPEIILGTYRVLIAAYKNLAIAIQKYTPQGVDSEFVQGFKQQLNVFVRNLQLESDKYYKNGKELIVENEIYGFHNEFFSEGRSVRTLVHMSYPAENLISSMDTVRGIR